MIEYGNYQSYAVGDIYLYECRICWSLVVTPKLHNKWHKITEEEAA